MNENLDPSNENFSNEDLEIDKALRPLSFSDFRGQNQQLKIESFCRSSNLRSDALDHTLHMASPGLGKNNIGWEYFEANELGVSIKVSSGPQTLINQEI